MIAVGRSTAAVRTSLSAVRIGPMIVATKTVVRVEERGMIAVRWIRREIIAGFEVRMRRIWKELKAVRVAVTQVQL
jgi:hypothetical protein